MASEVFGGAAAFGGWAHNPRASPFARVEKISSRVWLVVEDDRFGENPFMYIIAGTQKIVLVDTGVGTGGAHTYAAWVRAWVSEHLDASADLPILVINTHCHFDHVGGNAGFALSGGEVAASSHDRAFTAAALDPLRDASLAAEYGCVELTPYHVSRWLDHEECIAIDGDAKDGLVVLHTPGHTPDSLCLWLASERLLFVGDSVYPYAPIICSNLDSSLSDFESSIAMLIDLVRAHTPVEGGDVECGDVDRRPIRLACGHVEHGLPASALDELSGLVADVRTGRLPASASEHIWRAQTSGERRDTLMFERGTFGLLTRPEEVGSAAASGSDGSGSGSSALPASARARCTAISLARRADRWSACEEHLRSVLPPDAPPLDMFPGSDANAAINGAVGEAARLSALEASLGCTVYRDWPITETDHVRKCFPQLAHASDASAWIGYQKAVGACFRADRARLYHDFYMRHLSVGEMGASDSHLRVIERAHSEGLDLQIIFEDDARPTADALPSLLREVQTLESAGVEWDLIYIHSAAYFRRAELPLDHPPASALRHAGHRRVTHAYALSKRGIARIATCGYRASIFPYDDFLASLHAGHPRPDVMALPCVRRARGEALISTRVANGDGSDEDEEDDADTVAARDEEGQVATAEGGVPPFVGLTFPDEPPLCIVPTPGGSSTGGAASLLDSDSRAGHGSGVLLGDGGAEAFAEDVSAGDAPADACTGGSMSMPPASLPYEALPWAAVQAGAEDPRIAASIFSQLCAHSYVRVRMAPSDVAILQAAEVATTRFFARADRASHTGKGGRLNELMLWSCGYSCWPHLREQYHVVCGAPDAQPWPTADDGDATEVSPLRAPLMRAEALLRDVSMHVLCAVARVSGGGDLAALEATCLSMGAGTDPSVVDAFEYAPSAEASAEPSGSAAAARSSLSAPDVAMAAHFDPGVLTLTRTSDNPGLQLLDPATRAWVALEEAAAPDEVLVFAGEQLERASGARVRAANHLVARPPVGRRGEARQSVVFELRAPGVL